MKLFAKLEDNIVVEVVEAENAPDEFHVECGYGIRNIMPYPSYSYDSELDIFYIPTMEEPVIN